MNQVDARSVPVYGGFQGEFRKVHRARYEPVCVNGKPQIYDSPDKAEVAAWRALRSHLCGDIVRAGETMSAARSRAEDLFGGIVKGGRMISVERR